MAGQVESIMRKRGHVFERMVALFPLHISEGGWVVARKTKVAVVLPNHHQSRRIPVVQWAEQHCIHDTEDSSGRGNAKGQCRAGKQSKSGALAQLPYGVTKVL